MNSFVTTDGRIGDGPESGPLQLNNAKSRYFAINFMEQKIEFGTTTSASSPVWAWSSPITS
jgi:hypothetical protein